VDGSGVSILIGGLGSDTLNGTHGTDILIGDDTVYDANSTALLALVAEWGRTDITRAQKISDLTSGSEREQERFLATHSNGGNSHYYRRQNRRPPEHECEQLAAVRCSHRKRGLFCHVLPICQPVRRII
jgi:Ca2+-binding RTX toxin-like protein